MQRLLFTVAAALLSCVIAVNAADITKPVIHKYAYADKAVVNKMSNNGLWAVAQAGGDNFESGQAKIVNLLTDEAITLQTKEDAAVNGTCSVSDVTDDGNIVVGSYKRGPAYLNRTTGKWTNLPKPLGTSGGNVNAVTPDGKYAVGVVMKAGSEYNENGVMWDLTTNTIVELTNVPKLDMQHEDADQFKFVDLSPDGRYLLGFMSYSYLSPAQLAAYIYDTQKQTARFIGFLPSDTGRWEPLVEGLYFIDAPVMSPNGKYVAAQAYMMDGEEFFVSSLYDVEKDEFVIYNEKESRGVVPFAVDNLGTVYGATPGDSPIREWSVRYGGYWYSLSQIMKQVYGINFYTYTNYGNTGTTYSVSDSGDKILSMVDPHGESYLLELPKPASELCSGINLLGNYVVSPADGATFSMLQTVEITFDRDIEALGTSTSAVLKKDGQLVRNSSGFAVSLKNSNVLVITFRATDLEKGAAYTIEIPAGAICINGDESKKNDAMTIKYTGRGNEPVQMVEAYPADGSELARIDVSTSPVMLTFDAEVKVSENASASLYDMEGSALSHMNLAANGNRVLVYPVLAQNLYLGNSYKLVINAGSVTDVTGKGGNEEIVLNYEGTFERQISFDDAILFEDDFSDVSSSWNNFMRYEGDHNTPTMEMESVGFDADNEPWNFTVRDTEQSTDHYAASHSMYSPAGKSDDWMAIPQINIPDDFCVLNFDAQSYRKAKADRLKVYVWECDDVLNFLNEESVSRFKTEGEVVFDEQLETGASEDLTADEWKHYTVSLEKYAGKNIYIAFVNDNENQSAVFVDNIQVKRNMRYFISLSNDDTVVDLQDIEIRGKVTANSETDTFTSISLTLKDTDGNAISNVSESGLNLKKGDVYDFTFADKLPLVKGENNRFSIDVQLNDYTDVMKTGIKNLAFRPVKRVVLEEVTGITCPNCPRGIIAIERLEKTYGDKLIPISIHTYTGDPMGEGLSAYSGQLGLAAAPSAVINRNGALSMPMWENPETLEIEFSNGEDLWEDFVASELKKPAEADLDVSVTENETAGTFDVNVNVKYALNAKSLNLNLFPVVMEDGIVSYQQNTLAGQSDPAYGEWGRGGIHGQDPAYNVTHNDVVRSYYGNIYGTGGFLPQSMNAGETYSAVIEGLSKPDSYQTGNKNLKVAVMMFDANSGKLINSAVAKFPSYVTGVTGIGADDENGMTLSVVGKAVTAAGAGDVCLRLYNVSGTLLSEISGSGMASVDASAYRGVVIATAVSSTGTLTKKFILK